VTPFVLFIAFRHVRKRALQSGLTILGVAVGVMVLITALSLTNGFIGELIDSTLQATPHLTLQSFDGSTFLHNPETLRKLTSRPEVVAAAPFLTGQALIARRADRSLGLKGNQGFTQLIGIDPVLEQEVLDLPALSQQSAAIATKNGIVLGNSLALRQLRVTPGDEIIVNDITGNRAFFYVAGTFEVGNELIDGLISYLSISSLQEYLGIDGEISGYHIRLYEPDKANAIGIKLGERFNLQPFSWEHLFSNLIHQLRLQKALISAVVFLIVLVAAMGIANILVLTVAEKTEEIAILRALGTSSRQILAIFTIEGLLLGITGTLIGILLGLGASLYFRFQPYPLPGDLYFITQLPVELQWPDFMWVSILSITTSVLAGLLPARRASNLLPADILR
jgi:lipoprotein-releasing system permease protein